MRVRMMVVATALIGLTSRALPARADDIDREAEPTARAEVSSLERALARDHLLGDWMGARPWLRDRGVVFDFNHIGDLLANPTGGVTQATRFFGRFRGTVDVDLERLVSLPGGRVFITAVYQYGGNLGRDIGLFTLPSSIASDEELRLDEIFYEQSLFEDRFVLRVGKLAGINRFGAHDAFILLNDELAYTPNVNFQTNLPFSPAGQPGAMLRIGPYSGFYLKSGIYSGLPNAFDQDDNGLAFTIDDDRLVSAHELGFRLEPGTSGLPGLYRVGGNYDYGSHPTLLAPARLRDNYVLYFMANQRVYRPPPARPGDYDLLGPQSPPSADLREDTRGLEAAFTVFIAPSDRNRAFLNLTGQLRYTGLVPGRSRDIVGVGAVHTRFSDDASRASQLAGGTALEAETVFLLDYQLRAAGWLIVQPDTQLVLTPGGDPDADPALVVGLRTVVFL